MKIQTDRKYPVFDYNKDLKKPEYMRFVTFCAQVIGGYACIATRFPVFEAVDGYHIASAHASLDVANSTYSLLFSSFKKAESLNQLFNSSNEHYVGLTS